MTPPDPKPASDAEIAHGRITLDEMYACKDDCPALHGGRCFRCSIHPAILVRIDSDRAENDRLRARVAELEEMYGELQDWVGEQMTPPDVVEDALVQIVAKAEHFIPPHAYGDNVAACEFANLLEQIHSIARAALKPEPARGSEKP